MDGQTDHRMDGQMAERMASLVMGHLQLGRADLPSVTSPSLFIKLYNRRMLNITPFGHERLPQL